MPPTRTPEQHHLSTPTRHVPNSRLPVLIYRSALSLPPRNTNAAPSASSHKTADSVLEASARQAIERNHWTYGGTFQSYWRCHFHSVTHECYAVVRGGSRLVLGVEPEVGGGKGKGEGGVSKDGEGEWTGKDDGEGVQVDLAAGDVIVLPAGVSHCSISSQGDYEYLGMYPEGSPKYDNNFCQAGEEETRRKAETARKVPIPEWDPVFGHKGPLWEIWSQASLVA